MLGQPAQRRKQPVAAVGRRRQRPVPPVRVEHPHERRVRLEGVRRRKIDRRVVAPRHSTHVPAVSAVLVPSPVRPEPRRCRKPRPNQRQHRDPPVPAGLLSEKLPERVCVIHVAPDASSMPFCPSPLANSPPLPLRLPPLARPSLVQQIRETCWRLT